MANTRSVEVGDTPTDKYIKIMVRDNDFDVKIEGPITLEEVYIVLLSLIRHIEADPEEYIDNTGSSMVH